MGLLGAVELGFVDAFAAAIRAEGIGQAILDKASSDALHSGRADIEGLGNARIAPRRSARGLIGLEQDVGVLEFAHVGLAAGEQASQFLALLFGQRDTVSFHGCLLSKADHQYRKPDLYQITAANALNRVQFESDSSCRLGWAARVPI